MVVQLVDALDGGIHYFLHREDAAAFRLEHQRYLGAVDGLRARTELKDGRAGGGADQSADPPAFQEHGDELPRGSFEVQLGSGETGGRGVFHDGRS